MSNTAMAEQELQERSEFVPRRDYENAILEKRLSDDIRSTRERASDAIDALRKDMNAEFTALRGEVAVLKTNVEVIKTQLGNHETQLGDLKTAVNKVQTDVDGLRRDFGQFREETTKEFAALRGEMSKEFRSQTRWFIASIFAALALFAAMPAVWQFVKDVAR